LIIKIISGVIDDNTKPVPFKTFAVSVIAFEQLPKLADITTTETVVNSCKINSAKDYRQVVAVPIFTRYCEWAIH
jgi:hypothetical protein